MTNGSVPSFSPPQPLYEGWFLALYNVLYSTLPVLYIGLFEQVSQCKSSLLVPWRCCCLGPTLAPPGTWGGVEVGLEDH